MKRLYRYPKSNRTKAQVLRRELALDLLAVLAVLAALSPFWLLLRG